MENGSFIHGEPRHYKPLSELNLIDDFLFDVATMDLEICKAIIELGLNIRIRRIQWKEGQKVIHNLPGKRGIRLDFYVEDSEGKVFNVEMQRSRENDIGKRTRFYSALLDTPVLKAGERKFKELPMTYILFICGFDPFDRGKYRYTFERRCRESQDVVLQDELEVVFLNTRGSNEEEVEPELVSFLKFVENSTGMPGQEACDERISTMYEKIRSLKSRADVEESYMKMEERDEMIRAEGVEQGIEQGIEQGRAQGIEQGKQQQLISMVEGKLAKGKTAEEIAADLDLEESEVLELMKKHRL